MKNPRILFRVRRSADRGYEAEAVGYSIFTQADTIDKLRAVIADAVHCHFEAESCVPTIQIQRQK